jgi:hypothetical protein
MSKKQPQPQKAQEETPQQKERAKRMANWVKKAQSVLLNRKIVKVRYMDDEEMEQVGFTFHRPLILQLDDGTLVYPSKDDEGNDGGAIHYQKENDDNYILPVFD